MEGVLWYLLASTRGSANRVRIIQAIDERPRNANQLATALDLDYKTVQHHLDILVENNLLRRTDNDYGAVYLFTDQLETHRDLLMEVLETVDPTGEADED